MAEQRDLPHDLITQNILTRLPIKPLVRFKSVSKLWYSTLSSPQFTLAHFKSPHHSPTESLLIRSSKNFQFYFHEDGDQSAVDDAQIASKFVRNLVDVRAVDFDTGNENLVLVGSCNGLVCLGSTSGCLFIVWNPITREFRKYSDPEMGELIGTGTVWMVTWGFGYVSAIDDYKIVRICKTVYGQPTIRVHVFSVRFNKWKRLDNDPAHNFSDLMTCERLRRQGVLASESLYWMDNVPPMASYDLGLHRNILSFDLALELFGTFPHLGVSPRTWDDDCSDEFLCVVNGCLSEYGTIRVSGKGIITMLKSPGRIKKLVVPDDLIGSAYSSCKNLIGITGSDKIYTQYYDNHEPHLGFIDFSSRPIKHARLMTLDQRFKIEITSYCASLISPAFHDGGLAI